MSKGERKQELSLLIGKSTVRLDCHSFLMTTLRTMAFCHVVEMRSGKQRLRALKPGLCDFADSVYGTVCQRDLQVGEGCVYVCMCIHVCACLPGGPQCLPLLVVFPPHLFLILFFPEFHTSYIVLTESGNGMLPFP